MASCGSYDGLLWRSTVWELLSLILGVNLLIREAAITLSVTPIVTQPNRNLDRNIRIEKEKNITRQRTCPTLASLLFFYPAKTRQVRALDRKPALT